MDDYKRRKKTERDVSEKAECPVSTDDSSNNNPPNVCPSLFMHVSYKKHHAACIRLSNTKKVPL